MNIFKFKKQGKDELEEMLTSLTAEASEIDPKFKRNLQSKLKSKYRNSSGNKFIFNNFMKTLGVKKFTGLTLALSMALIVSIGGILVLSSTVFKSGLDEKSLISKVKAANPDGIGFDEELLKRNSMGDFVINEKTNYLKIEMDLKQGQYDLACRNEFYEYEFDLSKFEITAYNSSAGEYNTMTTFDSAGNIDSYALTTPSENYFYTKSDGAYKYKPSGSEVIFSIFDYIDIFGQDDLFLLQIDSAEYVGEEIINGKSYYVLEYSYTGGCNYELEGGDINFVDRIYVDKTTYKAEGTANYINEAIDSNLLQRILFKFDFGVKDDSIINSEFVYDLPYEVEDFSFIGDYQDYSYEDFDIGSLDYEDYNFENYTRESYEAYLRENLSFLSEEEIQTFLNDADDAFSYDFDSYGYDDYGYEGLENYDICTITFEEYKQLVLDYDITGELTNTPDLDAYLLEYYELSKSLCE